MTKQFQFSIWRIIFYIQFGREGLYITTKDGRYFPWFMLGSIRQMFYGQPTGMKAYVLLIGSFSISIADALQKLDKQRDYEGE